MGYYVKGVVFHKKIYMLGVRHIHLQVTIVLDNKVLKTKDLVVLKLHSNKQLLFGIK